MRQNDEPDARMRRLLADARPVRDAALRVPAVEHELDELGRNIVAAEPAPRRSRLRWPALAGSVGVASVLVTGVAFAGMYTTHTGVFPRPGTENDGTELLRTDAPDFPPIVRATVRDIPFPPGDSAEARVLIYLEQFAAQRRRDGEAAVVQTGNARSTFGLWGICAWRGYWLQEHREGSASGQRVAADGFSRIATYVSKGGWDREFAPIYLRVASLQAAGDASAPREFQSFYAVNCQDQPRPWAHR